jgi:stage V sporulation protein AA
VGILMFFNHFGKWKISTDPTPLEVEMRVYEDNISKTVIQNDSRKEKDIDVS